ncbi:MAG: hypothetical protein M1824_006423 [Vezdaea acicularis]|nr:MAG: hypothetical protein M1824_006423 [Vezdaea acicularis]
MTTVLDAPLLRDDFYCSLLAYCPMTHSLAVGLGNRVYIWSEAYEVRPMTSATNSSAYLTSLTFSSSQGRRAILASGRGDGQVTLWSMFEPEPRFEAQQPHPIACLAWRPTTTIRLSQRNETSTKLVATEELLVGDEVGNVYYYVVEWPDEEDRENEEWHGAMKMLARISVHSQQICGIAWSPDGSLFATGGNDNACCLFEVSSLEIWRLEALSAEYGPDEIHRNGPEGFRRHYLVPGRGRIAAITMGQEKHKWIHGAAVKAIAFCPWQRGLIATGGGSNDRCIHFFHTDSGACLATITVCAQVTSLLWSTTRREICATFGYAQPEHRFRIAVFSWPDCQQVVAIPWTNSLRALYAVPYPGGPNETMTRKSRSEGGPWLSRTAEEGCLVVAGSDQSIKFHEVWADHRKSIGGSKGLLGGSDILEALEGFDKEGHEVIR